MLNKERISQKGKNAMGIFDKLHDEKVEIKDRQTNFFKTYYDECFVPDAIAPKIKEKSTSINLLERTVNKEDIDKKNKSITTPYEMAKCIVSQGKLFGVADDQLYLYDKGHGYFKLLKNEHIELEIRKALPKDARSWATRNRILEVIQALKAYAELHVLLDEITDQEKFLNFINGVFDIERQCLRSHSPEYHFRTVINAEYREVFNYSKFKFEKFIEDISGGDLEVYNLLQEVYGLAISEVRQIKKAIFLYGVPHSGKSVFLEVLRELVGLKFCSSIGLHDMNDRYRFAGLYGMKLNTCAEVKEDSLRDLSNFKAVTGGDSVLAEVKYGNPFSFINRALIVLAGNTLPRLKTPDTTAAFFDRLLIIPFLHAKPLKKRDKNLKEALLNERDFIAWWSVQGLQRLASNNYQFTLCQKAEELMSEYVLTENSLVAFMEECCELVDDEFIFSEKFDRVYGMFCIERSLKKLDRKMVCRILKDSYHVEHIKRRMEGEYRWGYRGISLHK